MRLRRPRSVCGGLLRIPGLPRPRAFPADHAGGRKIAFHMVQQVEQLRYFRIAHPAQQHLFHTRGVVPQRLGDGARLVCKDDLAQSGVIVHRPALNQALLLHQAQHARCGGSGDGEALLDVVLKMSCPSCRARYTMMCVLPPVGDARLLRHRDRKVPVDHVVQRTDLDARPGAFQHRGQFRIGPLLQGFHRLSGTPFLSARFHNRTVSIIRSIYNCCIYNIRRVANGRLSTPPRAAAPHRSIHAFAPGKVVNPNRTIHNIRGTTEYRYSADVALESNTRPIHGFAKTKTVNRLTLFSTGHS